MVQLLIGRYSAGDPVEELPNDFIPMLEALEAAFLPHLTYNTEPFHLGEIDTYAYAMWLLSFAKFSRDNLVPRVAALFDVDREDNRGQDALYETLLEKLGLPSASPQPCATGNSKPILCCFRRFKLNLPSDPDLSRSF